MKQLLCVFVAAVFLFSLASSQGTWTKITSGSTREITSVDFVNATTAFAVDATDLLKTTDGGTSWTKVSVSSAASYLTGQLAFFDASTGVVAYSSSISRTTNGGTSWSARTTGLTKSIVELCFVNNSTGWLVGGDVSGNGEIAKTTDGGLTWTAKTTSGSLLTSVYFVDASRGWAGGYWKELLRTTDGGTTWTPATAPGSKISDIVFYDATNGLVVSGGSIYKSSDGGTSWTRTFNGTSISKLANSAGSNFWAIGSGGILMLSTDNGSTWNVQNSGVTANLTEISFFDGSHGLIVGTNGTILKYTDGGSTASPTAAFTVDKTTGAVPLTVQFTDLSTGGPTSWSWNFGDGGTSTSQHPSHAYVASGTYTVSLTVTNAGGSNSLTKSGYIVATQTTSRIDTLRNYDPKASRVILTIDKALPIDSGFVFGTNRFIDLGKATYLSLPAGATQGLVTAVRVYFGYKKNSASGSYDIKIYSGTKSAGPTGVALYTQSFQRSSINATETMNSSGPATVHAFTSPVTVSGGFFVAIEFGNYTSSDFGLMGIVSSEVVSSKVDEEWELSGSSWSNVSSTWWSTPKGYRMWVEAVVSRTTGVEQINSIIPAGFALAQNYPNPFNPSTNVNFQLPIGGSVKLAVYDLLGREVAILVDEWKAPGTYSAQWNGTNAASGIYFYRLEAVGTDHHRFNESKRMLLLK